MSRWQTLANWFLRPVAGWITVAASLFLLFAPAWLFGDLLANYRLYSDDFAYVGASRTLNRAFANLFEPHNTHIVPCWRLLTWALVALAGRLANLQVVLAGAAYGILAAVMLLLGHLAARETGRAAAGLAAMAAVGATSLMVSSGTWYSASQTLWAGFGVLVMLWYLQGWRRAGGAWRLVLAGLATWFAAGFWSVGHVAGPVGSVYLWADGRPRCRKAAWLPLTATLLGIAIAMALGGKRINATISFGGRTTLEATKPVQGVYHTLQAIPENLVFANLGLVAETTVVQGAVLTLALLAIWALSLRQRGRPAALECAGATMLLLSFLVEWSVRGYLPFTSLRGLVPWYDAIPDIGFVLFLAGWWGGSVRPVPVRRAAPASRAAVLAILLFELAFLALHEPRVEAYFQTKVPGMTREEKLALPIPSLQHMRAVALAQEKAKWQHRYWMRLDQAESIARSRGIGREAIHQTFGRLVAPEIADVYDAADMLALPWQGTETNPARVAAALGQYVIADPDPTPPNWILRELEKSGYRGPASSASHSKN